MLVTSSLLAIASMAIANGCSSDSSDGSVPPPLPTGGGSRPPVTDAGATESSAPPGADANPLAVDSGPAARRFTGTLAASPVALFGGTPNCNYKITLKQIDVDLTINGEGLVTLASIKDTAVEQVVAPCPYAPAPASSNEYSLATSSKLANGSLHIELTGFPTNTPAATLTIEGDFDLDGGTVNPVAEWHRTDQPPPLDWHVTATIPLSQH
jgi:hypothetical protein